MVLNEFLRRLEAGLAPLGESERSDALLYYSEMIRDRIEDGMMEEEAVAAVGSPEELARDRLAVQPLPVLVKQRIKKEKKRSGALVTVLAIVGFPVWLPLLIVFLAVVLVVYVVIWSVIAVMFAVDLAFAVSSVACLIGGVWMLWHNPLLALYCFAAALLLAGLAILFFFAAKGAAKGLIKLSALIGRGIKRMIIGKKAEK